MKALAERILKHPLKVIKCFHMPKLLAVEKNNFFQYSRRGFFLNTIIQPVGRTSSRVPVKTKIGVFSSGHCHFNTQNWETKARIALCLWQKLVLLLLLALHLTPSNTKVTSSSNLKLFLKHARPSLSRHFWSRLWRMYKLLRILGNGSNESSRREHSIAHLKIKS